MPYFVRIGAIERNKARKGARGYHLFRRGRVVTVTWGAIEARPGAVFFWSRTTFFKRYEYASVLDAIGAVAAEVKKRLRHGYSRLPAGAPIRRTPRSKRTRER